MDGYLACLSVCPLVCLYSHMSLSMSAGTSGGSSMCWSGIQVSVCTAIYLHIQWMSVDLSFSVEPVS